MLAIILLGVVTLSIYLLYSNYQYWERRGVPGPKPLPLVGNILDSFRMKKPIGVIFSEIYSEYPDSPIVGVFRACSPSLMVRDPDLIRDVTVKEFSHFRDNELVVDKEVDLLFGRNPFALKGDEWKLIRGQLTPCFSSGKMKLMYPLLDDISNRFVDYIKANMDKVSTPEGCDAKKLCGRYTLNNVASCAFGLEGKCFEEESSEFQQLATGFISPESWSMFKLALLFIIPPLGKVMSIKFTPEKLEKQLIDLVQQTLQYREKNNILRLDFLHIMKQLKDTCKEYKFTDLDIAAHAGGFIGDGYDTSSIMMSYMLYDLAANAACQAKLREEIQSTMAEVLDYDKVQSMSYLDAVVLESMRLHPPTMILIKTCTKDYTYTPQPGSVIRKPVTIEKDTSVILPVFGLQRDSKYYPDPDVYKPERFLGENKSKLIKYTYLPFGEGPRACLGQRFGVLQIKVGLIKLLKNFELRVGSKTKTPFTYDPVHFMAVPVGGIWIRFQKLQ